MGLAYGKDVYKRQLPGLKPLRNVGMNVTNAVPVLKNMLVRYAVGAF